MSRTKAGWTDFIRREGNSFLEWLSTCGVLSQKFDVLAEALSALLRERVRTSRDAQEVWQAVPDVLKRCNDQATYELPGAASAYAWLHLLDRYVRTWLALEKLVAANCIPMAKHGVRALDVGTGPGPSAFAIYDFYSAMTAFAKETDISDWRQPPYVACVERDGGHNQLRHHLAEHVSMRQDLLCDGALSLCNAIHDYGMVYPRRERWAKREGLLREEDTYFDEAQNEFVVESRYSADEANNIAQSLHRYRLFVFSNFLTTEDMLRTFEPNLIESLQDAHAGSVLIVLGGKGKQYPKIYNGVRALAEAAGFQLRIEGELISSEETHVADRIYEEGKTFYKHLQRLAKNDDTATEKVRVRSHFEFKRTREGSSHLWAFRKRRRMSSVKLH